jgi:hypothetical protein
MACCCSSNQYCCWNKDPGAPLAPGELPAVSACQDTPCAGMSNAFRDFTLHRSGPHLSGSDCASECVNKACVTSGGMFNGSSPVVRNWVYGLPRDNASVVFGISAGINQIGLTYGIILNSGTTYSPTKWLVWDYGEFDNLGNTIRPRTLLGDTGWLFGTPPSCAPVPMDTNFRFKAFAKPAIPRPSCVIVQVLSPCNVTEWLFQIIERTV